MKIENITNLAIKEARKSDCTYKLGCVIFNKNQIISRGHNYFGSRKKLHPKFKEWRNSIHAEVDAIINARTDLKGCNLLVVRANNKNELKKAKPCGKCMTYIKHVEIKRVYYSDNCFPYIKSFKLKKGQIINDSF